jgi:hypothetical protein
MGLMKMSTCDCSTPKVVERVVERIVEKPIIIGNTLPNPNPNNFVIKELKQIGKNVVLIIQYPDCTNYEGIKVMVYKNISKKKILTMNKIDPHFCENCISPFARFEPTTEGVEAAYELAAKLR